jgi:DnaJ-class molecular chaperone
MDVGKDYYASLGIGKDANTEQIKKAYRKLVIKHHPDKNQGSKDAEEKFKVIQEAYDVLSDPEKKSQYDQAREIREHPTHHWFRGARRFNSMDDISQMWQEATSGASRVYPNNKTLVKRGLLRSIKVPIYPVDVIEGGVVSFDFQRRLSDGKTQTVTKNFQVPVGIMNGARLEFKGDGDQKEIDGELICGDLIVMVYWQLPSNTVIDERGNAHCDIEVPYYDIVLGSVMTVPLLEGGAANVNLKKMTDTNISLRLRGKGFPTYMNGPRADMMLHLKPKFPKVENQREMELLREIKQLFDKG